MDTSAWIRCRRITCWFNSNRGICGSVCHNHFMNLHHRRDLCTISFQSLKISVLHSPAWSLWFLQQEIVTSLTKHDFFHCMDQQLVEFFAVCLWLFLCKAMYYHFMNSGAFMLKSVSLLMKICLLYEYRCNSGNYNYSDVFSINAHVNMFLL